MIKNNSILRDRIISILLRHTENVWRKGRDGEHLRETFSDEDIAILINELQVYQNELEIQNDELIVAKRLLEETNLRLLRDIAERERCGTFNKLRERMLQIMLVEDHNIVRNGIKALLKKEKNFHVIGEATNGKEALEFLKKQSEVDIILTDINMPIMDGISLIKILKVSYPHIRIVILSMLDNEQYVAQAFSEGASGYLLKNSSADELNFALKHISSGNNKYLSSELSIRLLERLPNPTALCESEFKNKIEFSTREIEVLNLIAQGLTNYEISEKLFLSKRTIEGHRQALIEKTNSKNSAALIRFAILSGIIQ